MRRTTVQVEPCIAAHLPLSDDYADRWFTRNAHPTKLEYQLLPGSSGKETMMSAQGQIGPVPNAIIGLSKKHSSSRQTHPMASLIDMDNSVFGEQTPGGGLVWEYDAKNRRELEVAIFHLRTHSGLSVTPESMPPSGIETKLSTIFDIASSGGIGLPKFHNRSA